MLDGQFVLENQIAGLAYRVLLVFREIGLGVTVENPDGRLHAIGGHRRHFPVLQQLNSTRGNVKGKLRDPLLYCLLRLHAGFQGGRQNVEPLAQLETLFVQCDRQDMVRARIQGSEIQRTLNEGDPGIARPVRHRAQHALVGQHHDNRMLGRIEAQSPFRIELRRQIVAAVRREEDRDAQAAAGGRLDEATHQGRCQWVGRLGFRVGRQV